MALREIQQTNNQNHWPAVTRVINIATDVRILGFQIDDHKDVLSASQIEFCFFANQRSIINLKTSESVGVTFPETDQDNPSILDRSRNGSLRRKDSVSHSV